MIGNGDIFLISKISHNHFHSTFSLDRTLKMNNKLLVPNIAKNLFSVSQFAKDNSIFLEFHSNSFYFKENTTKEVLLQGILSDSPYRIPASNLDIDHPLTLNGSYFKK